MKTYQQLKEEARAAIMDFLAWEQENPISWEGIAISRAEFERLGRRYGMLNELKAEGII